jgi:hypothetical protein
MNHRHALILTAASLALTAGYGAISTPPPPATSGACVTSHGEHLGNGDVSESTTLAYECSNGKIITIGCPAPWPALNRPTAVMPFGATVTGTDGRNGVAPGDHYSCTRNGVSVH